MMRQKRIVKNIIKFNAVSQTVDYKLLTVN
jgi:hypothetical protein